MSEIRRINSDYSRFLTGIVRNQLSSPDEVNLALYRLGQEVCKHVLEAHYLLPTLITTPVSDEVEVLGLEDQQTLVVTTKNDFVSFGKAAASVLSPARLGWMDFEGRRGMQALNAHVREMELPDIGNRIEKLVIAKSTLATGCTAISLTQHALREVDPDLLIIITIFHSIEGLQELSTAFPDAIVYCVGEPDSLDDNGILHPGVGILENRV